LVINTYFFFLDLQENQVHPVLQENQVHPVLQENQAPLVHEVSAWIFLFDSQYGALLTYLA
jgi:hypothetical protein